MQAIFTTKLNAMSLYKVACCLLVVLCMYFYIGSCRNRVVTIDIKEIVNEFINKQSARQLSDEDLNKLADKFSDDLGVYIDRTAKKDGVVIMPKQAVITGAKDITGEIKRQLFKDLT